METNLDGTSQTVIATGQILPTGVAVGGGHLYWANFNGTIVEANLDGTGQQTIATGQNGPQGWRSARSNRRCGWRRARWGSPPPSPAPRG